MSLLLRLPLAVVIFALWVLPGCVLAQASQSVAFAAADSPVSEAFPNVVTPDPWYYNVQENPVVGAGSRVRSLFKFNLNDFLPSIPAGAVVSAATLRLKATDQSDNNYAIDFFPTGDGWQQSTVTWNNRPAAGPTSMGRNPASGYTSHGNWAQLNLAFGAPGVAEVQAQLDGDRTLSFEATCATSTQNKGCSWMSLTANAGTKNTDWPRLTISWSWTPNPTTGATTGETTGATTGATTGQTTGARPPATTGAESAPPTSTSTSSTGTSSSLTSSSSSGSGVSITTSGSATTTGSGKVVSADSAAGSGSSESPLVLILVIIGAAAFCCLLLGLVLFVRARKNAANSSSSLVEDNGGSGDNGEVATYDVDKDNDEQVVTYASVTHLMESDSSISVDLSEEEDDVVEYASLAAFKEVATTP